MNKKQIIARISFAIGLLALVSLAVAYVFYTVSVQREYDKKVHDFLQAGIDVKFNEKIVHIAPIIQETFIADTVKLLEVPSQIDKSATIIFTKNTYKIQPEVVGFMPDEKKIEEAIEGRILTFSHIPIVVDLVYITPEVVAADVQRDLVELKKKLNSFVTVELKNGAKNISERFWFRDHLDVLVFHKDVDTGKTYMDIQPESFVKFADEQWGKNINIEAVNVAISSEKDGKIHFEGEGKNGAKMSTEELAKRMSEVLRSGADKVEIPVIDTKFTVTTSPELQAQGVKDILSVGHTSFYGSPKNRVLNISVGIEKFNGIVIPAGDTFSFNKNLGKVDGENGFFKELVIKPEGTIPEFGGGICQVSTTAYRAALYAGLPIVDRTPHSYAVSYYSQIGGHGIDATIYPGSRDLKFKNDTPATIVMQAYSDGYEAYFILYGTNDGRTVTMEGPVITNEHSDKTTETIKTTSIPAGTQQRIESSHGGFDALWHRYVTLPGGLTSKEDIISKYRATKDRFLQGVTQEELDKAKVTSVDTPGFKD